MSPKLTSNENFFHQVYRVTRLVPEGRVTTYGAIARYLGAPQAARMVGWALRASATTTPWVPAHRVVNRVGLLTGKNHFPGGDTMKQLLESEGVRIIDNRVADFNTVFWDPNNLPR